jgi:sulfur relay (sulfurtransferase) complex TusBCD TusD component (DsrE family)
MNYRLKFLLGSVLSCLFALAASAQQQPVVSVDIQSIAVFTGSGSVVNFAVVTGGNDYVDGAIVTVSGDGVGATGTAIVRNGVVIGVVVRTPGSGYHTITNVSVAGGNGAATVRAYLGQYFGAPAQNQNESYGPVGAQIGIGALAVGTNPVNGYTYTYYVNGKTIGTLTPNPANGVPGVLGWTPPEPGAYFITVKADDGISGPVTSLAVRYFAVGTKIISPVDNTLVPNGSSMVLQAVATPQPLSNGNNAFVQRMDFYADGALIGTDTTYPYSIIYTPTSSPTTHTIEARAFDNLGNQVSVNGAATEHLTMVAPVGTPPTCSINSPLNNAAIAFPDYVADRNAAVTIAVDAFSPNGVISKVELYIDGVLFSTKTTYPYTFTWQPQVVGAYNFVALAYDDKQNVVASTTSTTPTMTPAPTHVVVAAAPTVVITSPSNGASVPSGATLTVTANASNSNGNGIVSVQFFDDGVFVGEATTPNTGTTSSFSVTFTPSQKRDADGNVLTSKLTALAVDVLGISKLSSAVTVNVTGGGVPPPPPVIGQPPTITITAPIAGSQVSVNTAVTLAATASDPDGNVTQVQFLVNGQSISTDQDYPYNATWTPTSLGGYVITARVTDNDGNTVQATPVTVTVIDPSPSAPFVAITSPANGAVLTVGNPVTVRATATDDVAVASVQFFLNGQPLGTADVSFPYGVSWTPTSPGTYTLVARATDNIGNQTLSASVVVSVGGGSAPTVRLTSPSGNITVGAGSVVNLAAIAADADGTITGVRFLANGIQIGSASTAPYQANWTPTVSGSYSVVAEATDNAGNTTTSDAIIVTVGSNQGPTVVLTSPRMGATVEVGKAVSLTATATDPDGTISSVQFYVNGVVVSTDTVGPYSASWTPNSEGTYVLKAVAIDNANTPTSSAGVQVQAVLAGTGSVDTVASGMYVNFNTTETGEFTMISVQGKTATLIGYVPASQTTTAAKTYFLTDIPVDAAGKFEATDSSGAVIASGQFSPSGVSGSLKDGANNVTLAGLNATATSNGTAAGYYQGSVTDHAGSALVAIIGVDGSIAIYVRDGTFTDAAEGTVDSAGNFNFVTRSRSRFIGRADSVTGLLTGTLDRPDTGRSTFTAAQSSGSALSDGVLRNLSTRGQVGTGDGVLVAGFVINSSTPKHVLIRAIGPGLTSQGVTGALANPTLTLHRAGTPNVLIGSNDNWGGDPTIAGVAAQFGAFALPGGSLDAALYATLTSGAYIATVSGVGGTTGVAMVELYDADTWQAFSAEKLINISSRGQVGSGTQMLVAGFVVNGSAPKKVLIRGVGPALAAIGLTTAIGDPKVRLNRFVNGSWVLVRENDNWEMGNDPALVRTATAKIGAMPPLAAGSLDAALLLVLPPGVYTAELAGANGSTGVGLLEVYEVQ